MCICARGEDNYYKIYFAYLREVLLILPLEEKILQVLNLLNLK